MNREQLIVRALLETLANHEGEAVLDTILHAEINLRVSPNALLTEFDASVKFAEGQGWIVGVRTVFKKIKWRVTDTGRAAQLENA